MRTFEVNKLTPRLIPGAVNTKILALFKEAFASRSEIKIDFHNDTPLTGMVVNILDNRYAIITFRVFFLFKKSTLVDLERVKSVLKV